MRIIPLLTLLTLASPAVAQTDWNAQGRALFADIVGIPSVSDRPAEVLRMAQYLKGRFVGAGIADAVIRDHDGTHSLVVHWKAAGKAKAKPILLMGHMDVVEALPSDWTKAPFELTEENGYLYGRGTIDMKNGIAAVTNTILRLKAEGFKPKRDIIILFTGDEEVAGNGARRAASEWLKSEGIDFALNADAGGGAFLKDGTALGFSLQTSEKMYQDYTFTVRNPGGHSSRPRPDNAIYQLSTALKALEAYRFAPMMNDTTRAYYAFREKQEKGALGDAMRRWIANPGDGAAADLIEADPTEVGGTRTRCVATRLTGGHANNALPQLAKATVNCRIFPGVEAKKIQAELQALAGKDVLVEPDGEAVPSPPSPVRKDVMDAFTKAVRARHPGVGIVPTMEAGATDGLFFRTEGVPVYGANGTWIVTPEDERAHGRDERIPVKSFYDTLDHCYALVKGMAG